MKNNVWYLDFPEVNVSQLAELGKFKLGLLKSVKMSTDKIV